MTYDDDDDLDFSDLDDLDSALIRADFGMFCTKALAPFNQSPARHHRLVIERLEAVERGDIRRLMILMPPGSAKSTYASVLFPAWYLSRKPNRNVIGASHTASLAEDFSRRVMSMVREHSADLGYSLGRESAELWDTTTGGRYRSAGVGGPIAGSRADLMVIDDPIKSRADADSETYRERAWNWYRADVANRLKPGASVVLIQTRWHEDDLGGRLLQEQPDRWDILKLPALATANDDPLGRAFNEPLWPEWEDAEALALKRADNGERNWSALFQQDPRPLEGGLFKIANIGVLEAAPAGGSIVRAWDLAATEQVGTRDPDWTVGVKMAKLLDGRFVVLHVERMRGGPEAVERAIVNTAAQDGHSVRIGLPRDPGQAGVAQILYLTRKLAGYRVESGPETGDKSTRAMPLASQVNVGNVSVVRSGWMGAYIDELQGFPSGTKDDQVDASSRAFSMLVAPHGPATQRPFRL